MLAVNGDERIGGGGRDLFVLPVQQQGFKSLEINRHQRALEGAFRRHHAPAGMLRLAAAAQGAALGVGELAGKLGDLPLAHAHATELGQNDEAQHRAPRMLAALPAARVRHLLGQLIHQRFQAAGGQAEGVRFGRMDLASQLALLAVEALGLDFQAWPRDRIGICLAARSGSLAADLDFWSGRDAAGGPSPTLFAYTLPSAAIGEIAIRHRITGPDLCLVGGDAALRELVDSLHARGMRIVLDGVFNHTGRGFWPFHHIVENGLQSPYLDWFHVDRPRLAAGHGLQPYPGRGGADGSGGTGYVAWWDLPALPKLNHSNPDVREYIYGVAEHWLRFGIDGWRLDVPEEISEPGLWEEFRRRVLAVNPEAYLVGEIWNPAPEWLAADVAILGEPSGGYIEAGCQGTMRVVVSAGGTRAHSARSWLGDNAIHKLSAALDRLAFEPVQMTARIGRNQIACLRQPANHFPLAMRVPEGGGPWHHGGKQFMKVNPDAELAVGAYAFDRLGKKKRSSIRRIAIAVRFCFIHG